jgi:hypothetical protein
MNRSRKPQATSVKQQATSVKQHASLSRTSLKIHEAWCIANGYAQATSCDILSQDNLPIYNASDHKRQAS